MSLLTGGLYGAIIRIVLSLILILSLYIYIYDYFNRWNQSKDIFNLDSFLNTALNETKNGSLPSLSVTFLIIYGCHSLFFSGKK